MVFTSATFLIFFIVTFLLFHLIKKPSLRMALLIGANILFYLSLGAPYLLLVLGFVTMVSFFFGNWIQKNPDPLKKRFLWAGIIVDLIPLLGIRYLPVFNRHVNELLSALKVSWAVPVPPLLISIGVSFFTFQAISYLIDIYLETQEAEPSFWKFMLYMSFFPKLLQGPIERAGDLLPQLSLDQPFDYGLVRSGFLLFTWGLFKKIMIADRLALIVNPVFANVHAYSGLPLILAVFFFAFQIYFDFSGYTDMALGVAQAFQIRLTNNFNSPYLATNISDFWRRWHITFSRWILDYIFKPLQLSWRKNKKYGVALALIITFFISGLWHGPQLGFIIWGLLHGVYMASSVILGPWTKKVYWQLKLEKTWLLKIWQIFLTFNLVTFAWIFFRANSAQDALYIITHLFSNLHIRTCLSGFLQQPAACQNLQILPGALAFENQLIFLASVIFYILIAALGKKINLQNLAAGFRWGAYFAILAVLLLGFLFMETKDASYQNFLYFKF